MAEAGRAPPGAGRGGGEGGAPSPPPGLDLAAPCFRSRDAPPRGGLLDGPRCRYLCTARAWCRLLQLLAGVLLVAVSSVSYSSAGGYTGLFSLGGAHYYAYGGAYSGLGGAAGEEAQRLDAQFLGLQRPPARGAMAAGGGLLAWSCLALGAGLGRLRGRCPAWLLAEALLDGAAALGLLPGLYFYYRRLSRNYASPVCQERERLYRSKGYAGFSCGLHGAEIAAGLLAALAALAYALSAALAVRALRERRAKPSERGTRGRPLRAQGAGLPGGGGGGGSPAASSQGPLRTGPRGDTRPWHKRSEGPGPASPTLSSGRGQRGGGGSGAQRGPTLRNPTAHPAPGPPAFARPPEAAQSHVCCIHDTA